MIDEDPRFPNRKKQDWEPPHFGDKLTDAYLPDPNGEETEEIQLPLSSYTIIGSAPESSGDKPAEADLHFPISVSAAAEEQNPAAGPPIPRPPFLEGWIERIRKFAENPTRVYASAGVGLGILFGITIAAIFWHIDNPNGPYDLRSVTSSAAGLKGHLFLKWEKKLQYRLTFEPSEPEQLAGFSLAVANSPRPLSIDIQLKDAHGFVLCTKNILLPYDARKAAALAAPNPEAEAGNTDADKISSDQLAQGIDVARLEAQEPERELDKDIFLNQIGPDGQIASISAQGDIPCSGKAYESTSYWSFSPGFPSLAKQGELLKRQAEIRANEASAASEKLAARTRMATKAAPKLSPFYVEGEDSIAGYDASAGIIETFTARRFLIDKAGAAANTLKGLDFPVDIHYRCDQAATCTITRTGGGVLHAKLKK
jgi:hypothetical protein